MGNEQFCFKKKTTRKLNKHIYIVDSTPCLCNTFRVVEGIPMAECSIYIFGLMDHIINKIRS